jgi:ABC-type Na+ efflux pump permease subunit
MAGKIIGIAMSTLVILAVWFASGAYALVYYTMAFLINPLHILIFFIYFLLGFLLISSAIAGIGSVCNTLKEAQNLMSPITILLVIPLALMVFVGQNPDSTLAVILSYFPFFTPFLMMNRLTTSAPPGLIEIILSIILLVVSIYFMMYAAGKIFRVGILMYGKPPTLKDIWRMILEK